MTALLTSICMAATVHEAYASKDTAALRRLAATAPSREDSLLVRYRLYALTRERLLLARIPEDIVDGTPRELALLSALWAWRIPGSTPWNAMRLGRRSGGLLNRALAAAPADPLVRLIDSQSLIFRPGIAGGDVHMAIARLRALRTDVADAECGIGPVEVEYWLWYAQAKAGDPAAPAARARLLALRPPPLYVEMLDARF